jgi:hypothetical protein
MKFGVLTIICTLFSGILYSQSFVSLNRQHCYSLETAIIDSNNFHSAIRPFDLRGIRLDSTKLTTVHFSANPSNGIYIQPIVNAGVFKSINSSIRYNFGGGVGLMFQRKKWYLQLHAVDYFGRFLPGIENRIDSLKIIPHFSKYFSKSGNNYHVTDIAGFASYAPKSWISFQLGYNKHFVGDGYRSLFLSDNSSAFPFVSMVVNVWHLKYLSLLGRIDDVDSYSGRYGFDKKFLMLHYLSFNVNKRLNLGFFESIVWRGSDSIQNRGFDLYYLNPLLFMRPVEFSLNSPDNANMGMAIKLRLWRKTYVYGQLFLDDFIVKEFIANKGWWGNKYGVQFGAKSYNMLNISGLYAQAEYNFVRPYTYSHGSSLTNFGNNYQALAHPLGANFHEIVTILNYSKNKWVFKAQAAANVQGIDSSKTSFGANIYKSYNLRNKPDGKGIYYGYSSLQGVRVYSFYPEISVGYYVIRKWNMLIQAGVKGFYTRSQSVNTLDSYFFIGIRTSLNNFDTDF